MPTVKLTERGIAKLPRPDHGKQALYWDAELKGLGLLISGTTNSRTFIVQRAINGKTRRITIAPTNVISLDEARTRAEEILADFYRGVDPKATRNAKITLAEAIEKYLTANKHLRPRSAEGYRDSINRHLKGWLDTPLRDISREMVMDRHSRIADEVKATGRGEGHATANGAMRALRAVYNFALDGDADLPPNPVARFKKRWFSVPRRERMVKADQLPAFYQAVLALPNQVARDYLLMLLFTGMRRREASTLRWSEIDFTTKTIHIPAARMKGKRKLDLPMSGFIHDLLVARRQLGRSEYVFPSNAKSRHIEEVKSHFVDIATDIGIEVSAHDLRRTFVTVAVKAGVTGLLLKGLVAHAVGDDVTAGYSILSAEDLRGPAQIVCDKMMELCGINEVSAPNLAKIRG